jgi:hypothetical protein
MKQFNTFKALEHPTHVNVVLPKYSVLLQGFEPENHSCRESYRDGFLELLGLKTSSVGGYDIVHLLFSEFMY